jgi:transposase
VHRYELTDEQWALISDFFPAGGGRGRPFKDHRNMVNGILWILSSGAPWRDLPERYGPFQTVHRRHLRWRLDGTWERVLAGLRAKADARGLIDWGRWNVDSTSVRATRHAAGARKKRGPLPMSRKTTHWASAAAVSAPSSMC